MSLLRKATLILLILAIGLGALSSPLAAAPPLRDVANSWARPAIEQLVQTGVIKGYPDRTFRPDRSITRAEFATILAKAFHLDPAHQVSFKDVRGHWARSYIAALAEQGIIQGYPDGTFRPQNKITRAELTSMIIRALRLEGEEKLAARNWPETFADVSPDHWAFKAVELANRLGIIPPYYADRFEPRRLATRADTAFMVKGALDLGVIRGSVVSADAKSLTLTVRSQEGNQETFVIPYDALLLRNNSTTDLAHLLTGDAVEIVVNSLREPRLIRASGVITRADVTERVSQLTGGLLTPEQVNAIVDGNWAALGGSVQSALYNQLLSLGATPAEAESILNKDWNSLEAAGKERLAQAVSNQLKLPVEIVRALFEQDWQKVEDLAKLQLTQTLLSKIINH
ncbi:MAG: S-layer homology domain-containing protein [Bacillota bacterium]|nr:S-layer homology domain-containing protein [Bacillota bacterium]